MVVRRSVWAELGGLDRDYFMYGEDLDLGLRLWLAGHRVGLVPARARHPQLRVRQGHPPSGSGWSATAGARCSRYIRPRCSLLLAPALLAAELGLLAVAARQGWLRPKLRAQAAAIAGLPRTLTRRRAVQGTRRIGCRGVREPPDLLAGQPLSGGRRQPLAERAPGALLDAGQPASCPYWRADARRPGPPLPGARRDRRARDLRSRTRPRDAGASAPSSSSSRSSTATPDRGSPPSWETECAPWSSRSPHAAAPSGRSESSRWCRWRRTEHAWSCCTRWRTSRPRGDRSGAWSRSTTCSTEPCPSCSRGPCARRRMRSCRSRLAGRDRIIAVSAAGGEEIVTGLGIERERVDVVPNGVRSRASRAVDDRGCARAPPARRAPGRARRRDQPSPQEPASADRRARR